MLIDIDTLFWGSDLRGLPTGFFILDPSSIHLSLGIGHIAQMP